MKRRDFIKSSMFVAGALTSSELFAQDSQSNPDIAIFTKPFQHLNYTDFSDLMAEIGVSSVELPVRPKGHIEPEAVAEELPKMLEALKKNNLQVSILASGINSINSPNAEQTLRTAKSLGISQYRMAYFKYDLKKAIIPQIDNFRAQVSDLVAMNKEIGIQAVYQNHSGKNYFGAPLWDLYSVLKDFDPKHIGLGFDIGHATTDGGKSWPIQQKLLEEYTAAVYVKDPLWVNKQPSWVPL
ncbi:MAG: sugar phosphate isomerase/epimerase, partial [Lentisphaeraceae bacterium]|nr:sugar phosphate isomerase/epimerase [Lentisphaeraceae bacterium]